MTDNYSIFSDKEEVMTIYTEQKLIKFTEEEADFLKAQDNASELIRTLLEQYRSGGDTLYKQKNNIEKQLHEAKNHVIDLELELDRVQQEIEDMENRKSLRPEGYDDCVERLLNMPIISQDDLKYQAGLLNVDVLLFKRWLFDDGFFDKRLR